MKFFHWKKDTLLKCLQIVPHILLRHSSFYLLDSWGSGFFFYHSKVVKKVEVIRSPKIFFLGFCWTLFWTFQNSSFSNVMNLLPMTPKGYTTKLEFFKSDIPYWWCGVGVCTFADSEKKLQESMFWQFCWKKIIFFPLLKVRVEVHDGHPPPLNDGDRRQSWQAT